MKILGACLVIIAMGFGGLILANALGDRVRELQQFIRGMQLLAAEIGYGLNPLEVAFRRVGQALGQPVGAFFTKAAEELRSGGNAGQAWSHAVQTYKPHLVLSSEDWETVTEFSISLGNTDKAYQLKAVAELTSGLEQRLEEARRKMTAGQRIYRYAGFAVGTALVVMLY